MDRIRVVVWALLAVASGFLVVPGSASAQQTSAPMQVRKSLINQDVVQMVKARFADSTILKLIKANETEFDLSVPAVVQLKNAGVSQIVIEAMLTAGTKKTVASTGPAEVARPAVSLPLPAKTPDVPEEIGVYFRQNGKLVSIDPEIVNWRTGGVLKEHVTLGLDRGHVNGTVWRPHSKLDLTSGSSNASRLMGVDSSLEFYIHCPDGDSASEYQLLRFWEKGNRREFRTVTGGVLHASGGAQDNVMEFKFEKVAGRTYKIELKNLGVGEYGFLAPGTTADLNAASQGKVYTFRIAE
jgi:hypothetical protein